MLQECHYAGHGKPQYRLYSVKEGAVYFFSNYDNIRGEDIKNKHSFVNPYIGMGLYKENEKVFAGVYLNGLQTMIFLNGGYGKRACWDVNKLPEYAIDSLEDVEKDLLHEDSHFVQMESFDEMVEKLSKDEKENLLENFLEVLEEANNGLCRLRQEVREADKEIVENIISKLSS